MKHRKYAPDRRDSPQMAGVVERNIRALQNRLDGASIVGVNNRDLRTLEIDTRGSRAAVGLIPDEVIAVAESGLKTGADLRELKGAGYDAFLVGERFMTTDDPGAALAELLKGAGA